MKSIREIEVRYAETDMMGVVYHGNYIPWFEVGRRKFVYDAGFSMEKLDTMGLVFPIVNIQVEYKQPVRYLDKTKIITEVIKISKTSTKYRHTVLVSEQICAIGYVQVAHAMKDSFRLVNLQKYYPEFFNKYRGVEMNG